MSLAVTYGTRPIFEALRPAKADFRQANSDLEVWKAHRQHGGEGPGGGVSQQAANWVGKTHRSLR